MRWSILQALSPPRFSELTYRMRPLSAIFKQKCVPYSTYLKRWFEPLYPVALKKISSVTIFRIESFFFH